MKCVVHYSNQLKYSTLKSLSETNIKRIREAKIKRFDIGGAHRHEEQCDMIPETINDDSHGIHLEPCYKRYDRFLNSNCATENYVIFLVKTTFYFYIIYRFTQILGNKKFQKDGQDSRKSYRLSSPLASPTAAWIYPKECNICSKFRVQHKNKKFEPYKITTKNAQSAIKNAAKATDETLYIEISNLDLIAKEFKVHEHCYQNFTRGFSHAQSSSLSSSSQAKPFIYDTGKFEKVKEYVSIEVLGLGKAVSLKTLHQIYDLCVDDTRYRHKLKHRLQSQFRDKILFISPPGKRCEVIISTNCFDGKFNCNKDVIEIAANIIRNDIVKKFQGLVQSSWPPSSTELSSYERKPPESVYTFLNNLMKLDDHHADLSANSKRIVDSYAQDLVNGVTRGKVMQQKHFWSALGLHNLTGTRKIIDIIHKLGHCICYNTTCEIETAQAECAIEASKEVNLLPLKPVSNEETVFTHYWVDNFDVIVEKMGGGGSINTTHLVAFQEQSMQCRTSEVVINVPRKKRRTLYYEDINISSERVDKISEPERNMGISKMNDEEIKSLFNRQYLLWQYIRKLNSFNQIVPLFKGWAMQIRPIRTITKTVEIYLPPITTKVTDFVTIQKYLSFLQNQSESVNMPYVNITLDVGAAINAFKTVWTYPEQYNNVIIHLGSFHFLKENFQVIITVIIYFYNFCP